MNLRYALARIRDIRQEMVHTAVDLLDVLDFITEAAKAAQCSTCRGSGELVTNPHAPTVTAMGSGHVGTPMPGTAPSAPGHSCREWPVR